MGTRPPGCFIVARNRGAFDQIASNGCESAWGPDADRRANHLILLAWQGILKDANSHLPTGSKSSPILSYFVHKALFDEIASFAADRNLTMTLYVDDVVISGSGAHRGVLAVTRQIISKHGLRSHKLRHFGAKRPKIVTGIMVAHDGLRLPNRRHQRIKDGYTALHQAVTPSEKLAVLNWLGSLVHEAAQIDSRHRPSAIQLDTLRRQLQTVT